MDSVVGDDLTLPVDINGSCRLPDSIDAGEYSTDSMTAPFFPEKMSPVKALTMKDYENQITALKKENFNLKLRIYFMEERMQQKCDDSTEDIFKTNIELKVELESMKRELAEKQELLVSASKALESLAGRESGDPHRVREHAQREMEALRDAFNKRIADLEQCLRTAEEEVEKMAAIAEQEKLKNIDMGKQLQVLDPSSAFSSSHLPIPMYDMQKALQEKDNIIEQLNITLKNQEAMIHQRNNADQMTDAPSADCVKLTDLLSKKDQEIEALRNELHGERENKQPDHQLLRCISRQQVSRPEGSHIPVLNRPGTAFLTSHARRKNREAKWKSLHNLTEEFDDEYTPVKLEKSEINQLESCNKLLTEELTQAKSTNENLTRTVEDIKNQIKTLSLNLEEKEDELNSERRNALKRDKTIQGLTQVLKEKEKEIAELCHEIEDRDDALTKAREAAHKAQLQKYQGVEEHQNLLMAKQTELAQLQGEHHAKLLEVQKLQRALDRTEQELTDLQQAKDQLEMDLEDLQQQKKKGDKALNDLNNQLKKLSSEIGERENALEQQYQETLDETKRKLQAHEVTIQRLTSTLADREQQLQEYINMIRDFEQSKSPGGNDTMLSKLRQRLKEKEKALEQALDEKFAAIEEKDNEIHQLQLALREKERDMDRLNNLLSHNEETINSFDSLIKEKDVELQHLANTLKNLQRAKQDVEDNLNRSLREKDAIISQLQLSLEGKTKDMEEITKSMLSQSQTHVNDLAEQMGQRLKVTEAMLAEAVKARERLIADNEGAVEGLLATISSKDQLLKESAEHYNRMLSERSQEIQELKKQLSDRQQQLYATETQSSTAAQESYLETAELKALLAEKDSLINKLLHRGQERDQFLAEMRQKGESDHVLELRQTIQIMQEKLDEREAELSRRNSEGSVENIPITKKTVILKKELAQKTEALNKALKRENELKISLAELQSLLSELEGRNEGHAANIESLTSTLKTKDEIINSLHQRLGQRGDGPADHTQDRVIGPGMERSPPGLPQREKTMIGGDSQQEALPKLLALQQEHDALNKALRAEQQLYSSLVRTVKEQDSAKRLHALQLELTAVQLLRQHLEESVRTNEELREDLEREIHRAKLREGMDLIDPKELESLRHQLEDAQRWNASLQARLGAIQNRGGGVGGANDGGDTLSFIGDQTSYMSICVGEGHDDSLSPQELKDKVLELQDCVSKLQTSNTELQTRLSQMEKSERDACSQEDETKQLEEMHPTQPLAQSNKSHHSSEDKETQTDIKIMSGKPMGDESIDSGLGQSREHAHSSNTLDTGEGDSKKKNEDLMALKSLLTDWGVTSVLHLRERLLRLRSDNVELQGFLKEQQSMEPKEKASTDASGNSSDEQAERKQSVEKLQADSKGHSKLLRGKQEKDLKNSKEGSDEDITVTTQLIVSTAEAMQSSQTEGHTHSRSIKRHVAKHGAGAKSRLPIPVRLRTEASNDGSTYSVNSDHLQTDTLQPPANIVYGSEHEMHADCDSPTLLQENTSPSPGHRSFSPVGSDKGSDNGNTMDHSHTNSALFTQLELLHQECQEKEALIAKLSEQLADWEELHSQLQIKEQQYVDALQAAESTIAYLTACNLDSQLGSDSGSVDSNAALSSRCLELQKALQEKEELNNQLLELLNMAEQAIFSFNIQEKNPKFSDLCSKIDQGLQHVSSNRDSSKSALGSTGESTQELRQSADTLQDTLLEHNSPNAKLQEKRRATNNNGSQDGKHLQHIAENDDSRAKGSSDNCSINQEMTNVLMNCLNAAESAVASLAAHCSSTGFLPSARSFKFSPDLQMNLDKLQNALQERQEMEESTHPTSKSSSSKSTSSDVSKGQPHQELHQNVCLIYILFNKLSQRISELQASLQEERDRREQTEAPWTVQDGKALPPIVQAQLETLHKALREKKKACKSLEEKLATALTNTSSPETAQKVPALEQDDKGVQVDFQDLGYETSGKSENDREESSSTDLEVGVNPSCSASSLPSLLKQANFSSTENLDSTSSTPYPSSPARSSAKSLKGLQALDEYGVSEDPLQLQAQVRELKVQLENQTKSILQMQSLLQRNSLSSDLAVNDDHSQEKNHRSGQLTEKKEREKQAKTDKASLLSIDLERERPLNRSLSDQLQQTRSRSASPARLDSLVQSQARELSQLRQQIKESRRLGALHRLQLDELGRAFKDLLQASQVDCYMGEVVKEQLDKSLNLLDRLEGRLDKGESHLDNEEVTSLELSHSLQAIQQGSQSLLSYEESIRDPPDSPARIQLELDNLRLELEGERELLQQHVSVLIQHNLTLVECSREQLDLLANELQEKNLLIQRLRSQIKGLSPSSHHSSHSDLDQSDRSSSSCYSATQGRNLPQGQRRLSNWTETPASPVRGAKEEGGSGHRDDASRLQGLQRENGRLYAQLKSSEELNATLRSELDLHHSIMAQNSTHYEEKDQSHDQDKSVPHLEAHKRDISSQNLSTEQPHTVNSDLLAEHLQEIRALRQRLEESIRTNDRLREQLEKKLAEVEKDPATNIFIHGNEEQGQLANEVRFLWEQNQALKEQFNLGSRDKQKENEKLRETLARRTAKLEQSRKDCEDLRQENRQLLERLEHCSQENSQLQDSLHYSKEELHRLQCEVKLQRQQLSDSQHLLQSLRVELQVYEKMKTEVHKHSESTETIKEPFPVSVGSVDLGELLSEIRHLRLQLERSIQTNTALRQKLEEQLLRGASHSETININYLLSSPDEGGRSPGREGCDPLRHSQQCHSEHISIRQDEKRRHHTEVESGSVSSSSSESVSGTPSRLVPGHRMWANRNGRHILGLIEDYNALRKQISEGRKLSRCMDAQLQDCLHTLGLHGSDKVLDLQHLKSLSGNMNTMQQVLEEAGRLLKLVWRVSLPAGTIAGDTSNNEQDELLKSEIARLKSRLSQQERMLSGAVKRLRTTNQLKEGMERVIIDQLCLTHGVLKKARGNLETNYCTFFGLKGLSGGPDEGDPSQWPVEDTTGPQQISAPACLRAGKSSESLEDHNSETSLHCSY
ncbi:CDK5 regulatory subunit-associated protein 2 isoform X3 [Betta splendens]|uniref:CDK5 regulatory subunit-associated protein 2 isoform X3 n=1 Tax=Betta splendens TaxID=158456 RepID=A0A9W2Y652_BETSP|nr:CDK5 regulatory subunit-associated protein 2 isoform X3 [Betta splendens]